MTNLTKQRYIVRLCLNDREILTRVLDDRPLTVGRARDCDIVIDNLAVSRHHAEIHNGPDGPVIRDHSSTNGLVVDGRSASESAVHSGTVVQIGKHTLHFVAEDAAAPDAAPVDSAAYEATIQMSASPRVETPARLVELGENEGREFPIDTLVFLMGKSDIADIRLEGMLMAEFHADIKFEDDSFRLTHLDGRRKVTVNGKAVSEQVLADGDIIEIGGRSFQFRTTD